MKSVSEIDSYILKTLEFSNQRAKDLGYKKSETEFSYGIFVSQLKKLLHELNLTDQQKQILESRINHE